MRVQDKFDADSYLEYAGPVEQLAREVLNKLAPRAGERILDVGCGDGAITRIISKSGAEVHGIDVDEGMVRAAVRRGVDATKQSANKLSFENGYFDKIFSNSALHWVPNLGDALKEMSRVLKDGGELAIEFGLQSPPHIRKAIISAAKKFGYDVSENDGWSKTEIPNLKRLLKNLGYEEIEIRRSSKLQSFPAGMKAWLEQFVVGNFLSDVPKEDHDKILDLAVKKLSKFPNYFELNGANVSSENGKAGPEWFGDYSRVTVTAKLNKEKARVIRRVNTQSTMGTVEHSF